VQLGEKWAYDPHHIISNRRMENAYSPFIHEARPEVEKLANGEHTSLIGGVEIETAH